MSKKIVCAILALVLVIGLVPVSAITASAAGNKCGDMDVQWSVSGFYRQGSNLPLW